MNNQIKITITNKVNNSKQGSVKVYATQGISYSATSDEIINVNTTDEVTKIENNIDNIEIKGYDLKFDKRQHNYTLQINNEDKLNIKISLNTDDYKYEIIGNNNLQNNSIIKINFLNSNEEVVTTYNIKVEKKETEIAVPNTASSKSKITYIIATLLLLLGIYLVESNQKKEFNK